MKSVGVTLNEYKKRFGIEREFLGDTKKKVYRLIYNGIPASNWEDAHGFIISMRDEYLEKFRFEGYELRL